MCNKLKSPITWFGGKYHLAPKLLELVPVHKTYCEVFGGAASLLFTKEPGELEVYNDLNGDVVNFFRVLQDPITFSEFYQKAWVTPYSREEHTFCCKHLNDDPNPIERARRFFVLARYSFGGMIGGSFGISKSAKGGTNQKISAYKNVLCMLPLICERLSNVTIENADFRRIIKNYDSEDTFFYLDPPYLPETRRSGGYNCEMSKQDHVDLINSLKQVKGKVMLSGYPSDLYDNLGWNSKEWEVCCRVNRTNNYNSDAARRTEKVWMNY